MEAYPLPEKLIKKTKRAFAACDGCRKRKKKCDGETPCFRCKTASRICTYSKKIRKPAAPVNTGIIKQEQNLSTFASTRMYFQLYFTCLNCVGVFHKFNMGALENPKSKSALLQYNSILAMSTRAFSSNPKAYKTFENRARQLAGELFDDFTFDTAVGFELLAIHFWWDDEERFGHYRDLTKSILTRVYRSGNYDPYSTTRMMIAAVGLSSFLDDKVADEVTRITEVFKQFAIHDKAYGDKDAEDFLDSNVVGEAKPMTDEELLTWISLRRRLAEYVFKDNSTLETDEIPTKYLPPSELSDILSLVDRMKIIFGYNPSLSLKSEIISTMMRASAYYAAGKNDQSLTEIVKVLDIFDTSEIPFNIIGPLFIDLLHFIFRIAFAEKDFSLANRISGYQRKIAVIMPSAIYAMEHDMNLLKTISSEKTKQNDIFTNPRPALCSIPPAISPTISSTSSESLITNIFNTTPNPPLFPQLQPEDETFLDQFLSPQTPAVDYFPFLGLGDAMI
mmetsp:Transcript_5443/g.11585  ORF Transcript_5443/g.11585 Transcript_5443/m.11585 type:complete len:506 (-) Transcript_5443:43-1560(-)